MSSNPVALPVRAEPEVQHPDRSRFASRLDDQQLLRQVVDFYQARLPESPAAQQFLMSQGLTHPELCEHFRVGFADRQLHQSLPAKQRAEGAAIRGQLKRLGILHSSGHAHFNGCLMFPVFDVAGQIVQLYGCRIRGPLPRHKSRHLWLPDAERVGLFNITALSSGENVLLADSLLAAFAFWCGGFRHVTVACGPDGFCVTDKHVELLRQHSVSRVLLAWPNTEPGNRSAQQVSEQLQRSGIESTQVVLPPGKHALQVTCAELARLAESAQSQSTSAVERSVIEGNGHSAHSTADDDQSSAALDLLQDPKLTERILVDFQTCGLVGEEDNKLLAYLVATSRLLERPLAALIQSSSAAGKTSLLEAVLRFMPGEEQLQLSALTGQALYYMGAHDLRHKILSISEEQGMQQAGYALKLLQSEGRLTLASAEKDAHRGQTAAQLHEVRGPVALLLTTTREAVDEELENRCLKLQVDEGPEQTRAIQNGQRAAYSAQGHLQAERRRRVTQTHQQAQRLLRSLPVVIPPAELETQALVFSSNQVASRREHAKYLSLIAASTLLHQYQREVTTFDGPHRGQTLGYLQAARQDVELARRLMQAALRRSFDSLLPQTRQLLRLLAEHVERSSQETNRSPHEIRLTQRQMREAFGWTDHQVRKHLSRLVRLEYVLVHRRPPGNQRYYQVLCPTGDDERPDG